MGTRTATSSIPAQEAQESGHGQVTRGEGKKGSRKQNEGPCNIFRQLFSYSHFNTASFCVKENTNIHKSQKRVLFVFVFLISSIKAQVARFGILGCLFLYFHFLAQPQGDPAFFIFCPLLLSTGWFLKWKIKRFLSIE